MFLFTCFLNFFFIYYIKASPPADSEAIGEIFILRNVPVLSYALPRRRRRRIRRRPALVPRLGTRTGSTLLFSTTTRFSDMKQKRNYSFLTSRSIAKTSYTIRSSGVLLQTGRVFLMTFIVGVKSYMEVSNETSDTPA